MEKNLDNNFVVGAVLTGSYEIFDCIPHNLLIEKLSAYNFSYEALSNIYSDLPISNSASVSRIHRVSLRL